MKKLLSLLAAVCLFGMSHLSAQTASIRNCGTMEYLEQQLKNDPSMSLRMQQIEQQTQNYLIKNNGNTTASVVTIPVVFHVLYSTNNSTQNISNARIIEQLNVLNLDFSRSNADASNTPTVFQGVSASTGIQFCMAVRDPNGATTTGIIRKATTVTSFSSNDDVKHNSTGGDDAWDASSYLNIWVCNLGGGLLGYAQFPGGPASTDGVVVLNGSVGGPAAPGTSTPYHLGRTATHEVGHWVNLRHIWGDAHCGNDLVNDTPTQQTSNFGCPAFPHVTCSNGPNGDMFMNYMDYTDDACMNNFTSGQGTRANAIFAAGGARSGLLSSQGCVPAGGGGGCGTPANLAATAVTQTSATLTWGAVSGASSFNVQYRVSPAGSWNLSSVTTNSKSISGLTAATAYDFQVQAVCSGTTGTYSSISTFTTSSTAGGCTGTDPYEPNNSKSTAASIAVNTDVYALIGTSTDKDYYKFTTTTAAPKIKIDLDGLPADYELKLYPSSSNSVLGASTNVGTTAEQIIYNATAGATYRVYVYGNSGANNANSCYHLKVSTSASNFRDIAGAVLNNQKPGNVSMYPNPANDQLTITLQSDENQTSTIGIVDMLGRKSLSIEKEISQGANKVDVDLSHLQKGVYFVQVTCNGENTIQKLVIEK